MKKAVFFVPNNDFFSGEGFDQGPVKNGPAPGNADDGNLDDAFAGMQKLDLFDEEPSAPETGAPGVTQLFEPVGGQPAAPQKNIGEMVFGDVFGPQADGAAQPAGPDAASAPVEIPLETVGVPGAPEPLVQEITFDDEPAPQPEARPAAPQQPAAPAAAGDVSSLAAPQPRQGTNAVELTGPVLFDFDQPDPRFDPPAQPAPAAQPAARPAAPAQPLSEAGFAPLDEEGFAPLDGFDGQEYDSQGFDAQALSGDAFETGVFDAPAAGAAADPIEDTGFDIGAFQAAAEAQAGGADDFASQVAQTSDDIFGNLYDADPDDEEEEEVLTSRERQRRQGGNGQGGGRRPAPGGHKGGGHGGKGGKGGKKSVAIFAWIGLIIIALIAILLFAILGGGNKNPSSVPSSSSSAPVAATPTPEPTPQLEAIPRDEWYMRLVNRDNVMSKEEVDAVETTNVDGVPVDSRVADAFQQLLDAGDAAGVNLTLVAGYRSYDRQQASYDGGVSNAAPGATEHNLGLSADIMSDSEQSYDTAAFEATPEYQWLQENAANYGFILRYPSGKESVTGFDYEPWHYRYVGVDQAQKIKASGLTLEEYLAQPNPTGIPGEAGTASSDAAASSSSTQG